MRKKNPSKARPPARGVECNGSLPKKENHFTFQPLQFSRAPIPSTVGFLFAPLGPKEPHDTYQHHTLNFSPPLPPPKKRANILLIAPLLHQRSLTLSKCPTPMYNTNPTLMHISHTLAEPMLNTRCLISRAWALTARGQKNMHLCFPHVT